MKIEISENALKMIKKAAQIHVAKVPTICVFEGGCSGTMLGIKFLDKNISLEVVRLENLDIAISKESSKVTKNMSIDVKNGIIPEIIIRNNSAKIRCKCGKSFKK